MCNLKHIQRDDPNIGVLYEDILAGVRPGRDKIAAESPVVRNLWLCWDLLVLRNGVLYRKIVGKDKGDILQLVVPSIFVSRVIKSVHASIMSGHLGVKKTVKKIKTYFYWHNLKKDVAQWIRQCEVCNTRKKK